MYFQNVPFFILNEININKSKSSFFCLLKRINSQNEISTVIWLFFFRSSLLLPHLTQKMTSWFYRNCCYFSHGILKSDANKKAITCRIFFRITMSFFVLNSEVNERFWKRTTCKVPLLKFRYCEKAKQFEKISNLFF